MTNKKQIKNERMKKIFLTIALLLTFGISYSQYALPKNKLQLNAGFGFSGWGIPIYASIDYGIHKDISIGGEISFRSYNEYWYSDYYNRTIIGLLSNCNYHFNSILNAPNEIDLYAGLNIGFYVWSSAHNYHGNSNSGLGIGAQMGGRYYFSSKFAGNLELCLGNSVSGAKIGLTIKL